MKKGFTLVELSIVLVIIGLLIGGVLVGQSLIESAKLNSFVRQVQQLDIATNIFKAKYKSIPGDNDLSSVATRNAAGGGTTVIKNDGLLMDDDGAYNTFDINTEASNYFLDLNSMENVKFKNCATIHNSYDAVVLSGPNCNTPRGDLGDNTNILVFTGNPNDTYFKGKNLYYFMDCTKMVNTFLNSVPGGGCSATFTAPQAISYDQKVDDGVANSGIVVGVQNAPIPDFSIALPVISAYDISTPSVKTVVLIQKIGSLN